MKILIVAPMLPAADGPGATPVLLDAQLAALAGRHELTVVAGIGDEPWEDAAARAAMRSSAADVHIADRRVPPTVRRRLRRRARLASDWALTSRPWLTLWFAAPAVQAVIDQLAARKRFDLIAVEDGSMATFRLPPGVPAVLSEHEVRRPRPVDWARDGAGPAGWAFRELDWRRWAGFQRGMWHRYDRLLVFTDRDAGVVGELAPDVAPRVRVSPFGLRLPPAAAAASASASAEDPDTVVFVGNFTHGPNRDGATWLAREIMPRVRTAHPQARLRLIGSDAPPEIAALAGDGVELLADVPDVAPYVAAAAVIAAPVRFGGGMRMKVLSAIASGKAVVTTTRGAEGFTRPGAELPMLVADDADEVAAGIAALLSDAPRRHELGRRARAFAEEFHSPVAWGARLDQVYEEACACRPSRSGS